MTPNGNTPPTIEALILALGAILLTQFNAILKAFINLIQSIAERTRGEAKSVGALSRELDKQSERNDKLEERLIKAEETIKCLTDAQEAWDIERTQLNATISDLSTQLEEALEMNKTLTATNENQRLLIEAQRLTIEQFKPTQGTVTKENYHEE